MPQSGSQKKEWATPQVRSIELRDALTALLEATPQVRSIELRDALTALLERGGADNAASLSSNHRPLRVANR